jgi:hypothetical protein
VRRPGGKPHGHAHGDERWNAIPSMRQDPATTSAPDRLDSTPIGHDRPATTRPRARATLIGPQRKLRLERRNEGCPSGSSTHLRQGTHPVDRDEHGSSGRNRKESIEDDTLAKLLAASGETLAGLVKAGVRKNTTRGGRVSDSPAKVISSDPPRFRSLHRWKHRWKRRERGRPARHYPSDGADRRGTRRIPEETRVASAQDPDTARSASHRPTRNRGETMAGTNANAKVRKRGVTVMQGIIEARSERKNRHEGNLEGEQGPGRVGQRTT